MKIPIFPNRKISRSVLFALGLSGALILCVMAFGALCGFLDELFWSAFQMFPVLTIFTVVIFWLWLAYQMMFHDDE